MSFQEAFNTAMALIFILVGWLLNVLYSSMRDLATADKALTDKVQSIELIVAGQYVKRSEFEAKVDALFGKLDAISDKLDRKLEHHKL